MTLTSRLTRATCRARTPDAEPCANPDEDCPFRKSQGTCREIAREVAHELANYLDPRQHRRHVVAELLRDVDSRPGSYSP